jgi:hypothetical protein
LDQSQLFLKSLCEKIEVPLMSVDKTIEETPEIFLASEKEVVAGLRIEQRKCIF